jgi:hypothetical protein
MRNKLFVAIVLLSCLITSSALAEGILQITSSDASIEWSLWVNNEPKSFHSGMELRLEAGTYQITALAPGLQKIDQSVTIYDDKVKKILLSATAAQLVETTVRENIAAQQKVSQLVVIGKPSEVPFSLSGHRSRTPASFNIGVGSHTILAGELSEQFEVLDDRVTYLMVNLEKGKVYGFSMTEDQELQLQSTTTSREEIFEKGYKLYGKGLTRWMREIVLVGAALFLLIVLHLKLRYSLKGRAKAKVRSAKYLQKRLRRVSESDPKNIRTKLVSSIERNAASTKKFKDRLDRKIQKLEADLAAIPETEENKKDIKKHQKKLRKVTRAREILSK